MWMCKLKSYAIIIMVDDNNNNNNMLDAQNENYRFTYPKTFECMYIASLV